MSENSELLSAVQEIRDLVRLLAEPAMAERDRKLRDELRRIAGKSAQKANCVVLMDGVRTQKDISQQTGMDNGNLSKLVKQLSDAKLVAGDSKHPKLVIPIPANLFAEGGAHE